MKALAATVVAVAVSWVLITWTALEWSGVARLTTRTPDGTERQTHVWYVEDDGQLWVEAGTPENPWFLDIQSEPELSFDADGRAGSYRAQPVLTPDAQARVRFQLREKYGWRDAWVGALVDASRSVAVRLDSAGSTRTRAAGD